MTKSPRGTEEQHLDDLAYLLRLWRVRGAEAGWRASLVSPDSGERRGFASLEDLCLFLHRQTRTLSEAASNETKANTGQGVK